MDKKIKKDKFKLQNLITDKIKEALKEYLENVEFEMGYINSNIVFQVKDIEVKKDVLKRFGIPLELVKGRVQEIKITIQSLRFTKPVLIEVNGVNLDISTIYLSRDYKKDYRNSRQKYLDEWEKNHRDFLRNLMSKDTLVDSFINYLIPIKIEINNFRIQIIDTITAKNKKIVLSISKITSNAIDENSNTIQQVKGKVDILRRKVKIRQVFVSVFKGNLVDEEDEDFLLTKTFIDPIDIGLKVEIPFKPNSTILRTHPKLKLEANVDTPIIFNISLPKLKFLMDLMNYLTKIKGVEKYLIHRPDIRDEKIDETKAKAWFNYAFKVIRQEVQNKKRKYEDFPSLIEKTNIMEKYVDLYKTSHKLIIAPWIKYNSCAEDLQAYENKLTMEDIIFCREIAFTELITEGKAFCSSGEIGQGYKSLIHLWEFYVNDLRSKWIKKTPDQPKQIELSNNEKRDLMMLNTLDKDKVILSYLKGEPNHPLDILQNIKVCFDVVVFNFYRKSRIIKNDTAMTNNIVSEFKEQVKFYNEKYITAVTDRLKTMNFIRYFNDVTNEEIEACVKQESEDLNESIEEENNYKEVITEDKELDQEGISDDYLEKDRLIEQGSNIYSGKNKESSLRNKNNEFNVNANNVISSKSVSDKNESNSGINQNRENKSLKKTTFNTKLDRSVNYLDDSEVVEMDLNNMLHDNNLNTPNNPNNNINKDNISQMASGINQNTDARKIPSQIGRKSKLSSSLYNEMGTRTNVKTDSIPQYHYNKIPKAESNITESNIKIPKNSKFFSREEEYHSKLQKYLLSIVFGNFKLDHSCLRNTKSDSHLKIGSLNFIDHNLTYVGINKHNKKNVTNISIKNDMDYVANIFKNNFEERPDNPYYYDESNTNENSFLGFYLSHYMAEFLFNIFNCEAIREIVLKDLEPERDLIEEYILRFNLKEINSTIDYDNIVEFYQKSVIKYFDERKYLEEKEVIIREVISKCNKNKKLLNEKKIIFNNEFLFKVFEKGVKKKFSRMNPSKFKLFEDSNIFNEKMRSALRKSSAALTQMRMKEEQEIKAQMICDLNVLMTEVCVNLIKYVFSGSYMYLMNDKIVQSYFKKNIKNFCEKIKEKYNSSNKQEIVNKPYGTACFGRPTLGYEIKYNSMDKTGKEGKNVIEISENKEGNLRNTEYNSSSHIFKPDPQLIRNTIPTESHHQPEDDKNINYFLTFSMTKDGREYPHFISKEFINTNDGNEDITEKLKDEALREKITKNEPTKTIIEIDKILKNLKNRSKKKLIKLRINKDIYVKISNELIAEVQCLLPYLKQNTNQKFFFFKNILSDLKKSYLDIFENFKHLKAKWKMIEYLKKMAETKRESEIKNIENYPINSRDPNVNTPIFTNGDIQLDENYLRSIVSKEETSEEMYYLIGALEHMENEINSKFALDVKISNVKINLIDKLFFVTYEEYSTLVLAIENISIYNCNMDSLPLYSVDNIIVPENKKNFVKNSKNFDFNLVLKSLYEILFQINKISISVDNNVPLLQTEISVKFIQSIIPNIPFLPSKIIDMYTPFIKIHVVPKLMKVSFFIKNLKYYKDLYEKKFLINSEKQIEKEIEANIYRKKEKSNSFPNLCKIISHSHKRFQKGLLKIFKNEEKNKNFISYLANRSDTIFFCSIGKLPGMEFYNSPSKIKREYGIYIDLMQDEKTNDIIIPNDTYSPIDAKRSNPKPRLTLAMTKNSTRDNGFIERIKNLNVNDETNDNNLDNKLDEIIPLEANFITFSNNSQNLKNNLTSIPGDKNRHSSLKNGDYQNKKSTNDTVIHPKDITFLDKDKNTPQITANISGNPTINRDFRIDVVDTNSIEDKSINSTIEINNQPILTLHIPILIFNKRNTLFYCEKQLWLSDAITYSTGVNNTKNFENLKIELNSESTFHFSSFEFLFCRQFLNAVDYFKNNKEDIHSLENVNFTSKDFPFDFQFSAPGSCLKFNKLFSQISFFYESEPKFKKNIYPKLFPKINKKFSSLPLNNFKNLEPSLVEKNILSCLKISIKKISSKIIFKHNAQMFNFYSGIKAYSILDKDFELNKLIIPPRPQDELKQEIANSYLENFTNPKELGDFKIAPMLSTHVIRINIQDMKFKAFHELQNRNDNLMLFICIKNISYNENENFTEEKSSTANTKNLNIFANKIKKKLKLSNFFISSVKIVMSVPNYFRKDPMEEERVKILNEQKMKKIYEKMKNEENKLIVFAVSNLSMKLIEKNSAELKIQIGDMIKLGFARRSEDRVKPHKINYKDIEPIMWIISNLSKIEENVLSHKNSAIRDNLSSKNSFFKSEYEQDILDKLTGLNLINNSKNSIKLTFTPNSTNNNFTDKFFIQEKEKLFSNLHHSMRIIKSFKSQDGFYTLNFEMNVFVIEIPSYIYNYIFYLRNYFRELDMIINKRKVENYQNVSINYVNYLTRYRTSKSNNTFSLVNQPNRAEILEKRYSESKEKVFSMINIEIPYLNIRLRQKKEDSSTEIVFFDFSLSKIQGNVIINKGNNSKSLLQLNAEDINLKPYDSRYSDFLTRNDLNDTSGDINTSVCRLEIKLGTLQKESGISEFLQEGSKAREKTDEEIRVIGYLSRCDLFFINRFLIEIICFVEQNGECLKENLLQSDFDLLNSIKFEEDVKFKLYIKDGRLIVPESSKSANLIGINFTDGSLIVKKSNDIPKIMLEPANVLQIIDKKCTFNTNSLQLTENDLIPHNKIECNIQNVYGYFYIDGEFEEFFKASKLCIQLRQPINDSKITQLRKIKWKEQFNTNIACYKPSVFINLGDAKLKTSLGKLFSLKFFVDNNIDEKSSILTDTNAMFNNIEIETGFLSGELNVNVYKFYEGFNSGDLLRIQGKLPGYQQELNSNRYSKKN